MQAVVKKWLREKEYGFLDNGSGPDILYDKKQQGKGLKATATKATSLHLSELCPNRNECPLSLQSSHS
jgi:hypothetical protein